MLLEADTFDAHAIGDGIMGLERGFGGLGEVALRFWVILLPGLGRLLAC